jgi:hypothetical protein
VRAAAGFYDEFCLVWWRGRSFMEKVLLLFIAGASNDDPFKIQFCILDLLFPSFNYSIPEFYFSQRPNNCIVRSPVVMNRAVRRSSHDLPLTPFRLSLKNPPDFHWSAMQQTLIAVSPPST